MRCGVPLHFTVVNFGLYLTVNQLMCVVQKKKKKKKKIK